MSLSKSLPSLVFAFLCLALLSACGAAPANKTGAVATTPADALATSEFPFSTKEPNVYQGDCFAGGSDYQVHWFVARNGDKWRIDYYKDDVKDRTVIRTDHVYYVDNKRKIYSMEPEGD